MTITAPTQAPTEAPSQAPLSRMEADERSFRVEAYEKIDYTLQYVDGVFDVASPELADLYRPWGRCLMVVDSEVEAAYGEQARAYFAGY